MTDHNAKWTTMWMARALAYIIFAYIMIVEVLLLQGFLLRLFGADESAGYTRWAYNSLDRVMEPFRGMFTPIEFEGSSVLDTSILFAMVIYGVVALAIRALLDWLTFRLAKNQRQFEHEEAVAAATAAARTSASTPVVPPTPTATVDSVPPPPN